MDIRSLEEEDLRGIDCVVHLAAVSNDPLSNRFEQATWDINFHATADLARKCRAADVRRFVFSSSCSVYGFNEAPVDEASRLNPLTPYARSKAAAEEALAALANADFSVAVLRNATAYGVSPAFRRDLVLNDFVAQALSYGRVRMQSTGESWRPLVDITDINHAICYFSASEALPPFTAVNIGFDELVTPILELARVVAAAANVPVEIDVAANTDRRSYRPSFGRIRELMRDSWTTAGLDLRVSRLLAELEPYAEQSLLMTTRYERLPVLQSLVGSSLSRDLTWVGGE